MISPTEIRKISRQRLGEATILAQNGHFDGAFYLTGYCIELELKAKICEKLNIPNLFSEDDTTKIKDSGFAEIRKAFKTHNLMHLLWLSGLRPRFDSAKSADFKLFQVNSLWFENWHENYRYKPCGYCKPSDVTTLL